MSPRPRIALLCDRPGWAYDRAARGLQRALADRFELQVRYVVDGGPAPDCDLLHVFFWGETLHHGWGFGPERVVKEISSHRWSEPAFGALTPPEFAARHLADAGTLTCTSSRLLRLLAPVRPVHLAPNGVDVAAFAPPTAERSGPVRFGWAGNGADPQKGLHDVLRPAAGSDFALALADGAVPAEAMAAFYRQIDVLLVASPREGEPLTLLEAMAAGCFPIATDVGIVPELVQHGRDGLVVERNPAAFRAAMQWACRNAEAVRRAGRDNARRIAAARSWAAVAPAWATAWHDALARLPARSAIFVPHPENLERNLGVQLGEWPERAAAAARAIAAFDLPPGSSVLDLGCGRQTLRGLLPAHLRYHPVDRLPRTPDTEVHDLRVSRPAGSWDAIAMLGLLEYCTEPEELLRWAASRSARLVFSYNDCTDAARAARQHWQSRRSFADLERALRALGAEFASEPLGPAQRLYRAHCPAAATVPGLRTRRVALLSAAVTGTNSGDAVIERSVRRLLAGAEFERLPLLRTLSAPELERLNACETAVVCGTNLYQRTFACALTPPVLAAIRVPLVPLGIGGSSEPGTAIAMDGDGVRAVRMLHERCEVGSVRDLQAHGFLRRIGVHNVELTGCPVLFDGIREPRFAATDGGRLAVSVRARLLHVAPGLEDKARAVLRAALREPGAFLVLQSPYDLPVARALQQETGCEVVADPAWQEGALAAALGYTARTAGFRLHYGMLCLAHGRPATFVGTDTRSQAFCAMMGLPFFDLRDCRIEDVRAAAAAPGFDRAKFGTRWRALRRAMQSVLERNGLRTVWRQPQALQPACAETS